MVGRMLAKSCCESIALDPVVCHPIIGCYFVKMIRSAFMKGKDIPGDKATTSI